MLKLLKTPSRLGEKAKSVETIWKVTNGKMLNFQFRKGEEIAEHDVGKEVLNNVRNVTVCFTVEGVAVQVGEENILYMTPLEKHRLYAKTDADLCVVQIVP